MKRSNLKWGAGPSRDITFKEYIIKTVTGKVENTTDLNGGHLTWIGLHYDPRSIFLNWLLSREYSFMSNICEKGTQFKKKKIQGVFKVFFFCWVFRRPTVPLIIYVSRFSFESIHRPWLFNLVCSTNCKLFSMQHK